MLLSIRLCEKNLSILQLYYCLFLLFAGTVLHTQISYAPVFLGYVITTVWTLIAWQLLYGNLEKNESSESVVRQRFGRRDVVSLSFFGATTGVAIALLVFTVVFFAFFPRIGVGQLSFLKRGSQRLPDSVDLAENYRVAGSSGDIVARIKGIPYNLFEKGLYLRGQVYDQITGSGFSKTDSVPQAPVPAQLWSVSSIFKDEIFLQPSCRIDFFVRAQQTYIASGGTNPSSSICGFKALVRRDTSLMNSVVQSAQCHRDVNVTFPLIINQLKDESLQRPERYNVLYFGVCLRILTQNSFN